MNPQYENIISFSMMDIVKIMRIHTQTSLHYKTEPAVKRGNHMQHNHSTRNTLTLRSIVFDCLKGQCHEIFDFRFFHESVSPKPLSIAIRTVWNFFVSRKFRGDFHSPRPLANFSLIHLDLRISPRIFEKFRNDSTVISRGLWEDNS